MNRPDVILDRERFIEEFETYYKDAVKIDPETLEIKDLDKPFILLSQDEKIHHRYSLHFILSAYRFSSFMIAMMFSRDIGIMVSSISLPVSPREGQL